MSARSFPPRPAELSTEDEARLIEKSRHGDTMAFSELVAQHQGRVRAYVGGSIGRPDVVDDLAQEVFLGAFRSLETYKGDAPLGVWLLGIARNKLLMHLRHEVRRLARESGSLDAVLVPFRLGLVEAEELELVRREREIGALQRCLDSLPTASAAMIAERYFKARSVADIARGLGRREGTVRMSLMRVRQALRGCIEARLTEEKP